MSKSNDLGLCPRNEPGSKLRILVLKLRIVHLVFRPVAALVGVLARPLIALAIRLNWKVESMIRLLQTSFAFALIFQFVWPNDALGGEIRIGQDCRPAGIAATMSSIWNPVAFDKAQKVAIAQRLQEISQGQRIRAIEREQDRMNFIFNEQKSRAMGQPTLPSAVSRNIDQMITQFERGENQRDMEEIAWLQRCYKFLG